MKLRTASNVYTKVILYNQNCLVETLKRFFCYQKGPGSRPHKESTPGKPSIVLSFISHKLLLFRNYILQLALMAFTALPDKRLNWMLLTRI